MYDNDFSQSQNNSLRLKNRNQTVEQNKTFIIEDPEIADLSQKDFFQLLKNEFQLGMKYEARGGETEEKKGLDLFLQTTLRSHNKSSYWRSVTN